MGISTFKVIATATVAVAASLLLVTPVDAGKKVATAKNVMVQAPAAAKLEGAWIAKVVGAEGIPQAPPGMWTYVLAPEPSGRHAAGHGSIDIGFYVPGVSDLADETSPLLIDIVMTGPDTGQFNSVWYGLKKGPTSVGTTGEIVYIGVNHGTMKFVAPGKSEGTHNIEFFWPESDTDNDGLPDPGATPIAPATVVYSVDSRLGQY